MDGSKLSIRGKTNHETTRKNNTVSLQHVSVYFITGKTSNSTIILFLLKYWIFPTPSSTLSSFLEKESNKNLQLSKTFNFKRWTTGCKIHPIFKNFKKYKMFVEAFSGQMPSLLLIHSLRDSWENHCSTCNGLACAKQGQWFSSLHMCIWDNGSVQHCHEHCYITPDQ